MPPMSGTMKYRLLAMGAILSLLGVGLFASRGYSIAYVGLSVVGLLLLIVGLFWKR